MLFYVHSIDTGWAGPFFPPLLVISQGEKAARCPRYLPPFLPPVGEKGGEKWGKQFYIPQLPVLSPRGGNPCIGGEPNVELLPPTRRKSPLYLFSAVDGGETGGRRPWELSNVEFSLIR